MLMKQVFYFFIVLLNISCGCEQKKLSVIGTRTGELITVKPYEVKDTVDIYLSDLVEDIEIIRLETTKNAFVKKYGTYVFDNYIVMEGGLTPTKLFERKTGKFIGNVGNNGRGPGEYLAIYSLQIDEEKGNIYMLSI